MNDVVIELGGLTKVFVTDEVETHALSGIHLSIGKGEYVSIAGPSGCGKSTLLSIMGLLDSPTDGSYVLNGKPVQSLSLSVCDQVLGHRDSVRRKDRVDVQIQMVTHAPILP